jgi:hypothetical protein
VSEQSQKRVDDLSRPVEELTPEQAQAAEGGIIAILIGLAKPTPQPEVGTQVVCDGSVRVV